MVSESNIASYTTSLGNKINFTFKDGSTGYGVYNKLTGAKLSGTSNAPAKFTVTAIAKAVKFTTDNLKNLYNLLPINFIIGGVVSGGYKSIISNGISLNKANIISAAKSKIKSLLGVFALPVSIFNKTTSKLPTFTSIVDKSKADVKQFIETNKNIVENNIKQIKNEISNTSNVGDLGVSKYSKVDNLTITSPAEKKELTNSLAKQKMLEDKVVEDSSLDLQNKAIKKVEIQVEPVQTTQPVISTITEVK